MKPKIKDMDQGLQVKYLAFAGKMTEAGIPFILNCVLRLPIEQEAFYAQGREPLEKVNELRRAAGMYELSSEKENIVVTHTKISRHFPNKEGKATAFDIAIIRDGKKPTWDTKWDGNEDGISDYREAAFIGQAVGLEAGGLWESWQDWPHYQLRG